MTDAPAVMPAMKMNGRGSLGRLFAIEGILLVLVEASLDRPDITTEKAEAILQAMAANAKALTNQMAEVMVADANPRERAEKRGQAAAVIEYADRYIDETLSRLRAALPAMKGDTGVISG